MTNLAFDLKHALRSLVKSPARFATAVLLLALGIGGLLVGVTAHDLPTYLAAALLFVLITIAACLVPAWHASRVNPNDALREE
jgi:ABC-type antimicrobial peptide transport system permease subunit